MNYLKAIDLKPNLALAHQYYGAFLSTMGRTEEAISVSRYALALDPLSYKTMDDLALSCSDIGLYEEALQLLDSAIELEPQLPSAYQSCGIIYYLMGREVEAVQAFLKAVELSDNQKRYQAYYGWILGMTGQRSKALKILTELQQIPFAEGCIALIYIGLGQKDQAFEWLDKAYQAHSSMMILLKVDPYYAPLRSDPRFRDLLEKMRFPDSR